MELKLVDVSKFYQTGKKSVKGLENINLTFTTDSSFVVVTGESGSGKTTLIKLLTGIENYDDGEIYFDDIPISTLSPNKRQDIYSQNISFVFQDYNLIEGFTVKENIMLALLKKGVEKKEASKKALGALEKLKIEKLQKKKVSKLSGGEKQRVAIARALSLESKVIIFDEPTGNLDKETSEILINVIKETCKDKLIIYVTHEYSLVQDAATRHITLQDGHVIEDKSFKKEKNDNTKVIDKETKFSFKSLLYITRLFTFKRIGRLIFSILVLFASVLTSFGVSIILATTFTSPVTGIGENTYLQGNVINVKNKNDVEVDKLSSNAYYDVNSLIFNSNFSLYYKDFADSLTGDSKTISGKLASSVINNNPMSINTSLDKGLDLRYGEESKDPDAIYLVLDESSVSSVFNKAVKERYEAAIGKDVVLASQSTKSYYYDSKKSLEDYKTSSNGNMEEDYYSLLGQYVANNLKEAKTFKLAGIYVYSKNYTNYTEEYIYAPSFNVLKDIGEQLTSHFEVKDIDIVSKEKVYITQPSSGSYNLAIATSNGKYLVKQGKEDQYSGIYYESEIEPSIISKLNFNELNTIYLSDYWQEAELDIIINNTVYKKSQLSNIRYVSNDLIDNKYYFYTIGNPLANIINKSKQSGKLYYQSENDAYSAMNQLKDKADIFKYDARKAISYVPTKGSNLGIPGSVLQAILFLFYVAALFGGLALFRLIFNKLYFRKASDQFVLNYIGYKRKDIFFTNLIQFEAIAIISNIIIYSFVFAHPFFEIPKLLFFAVPYFFIATIIINLLFISYLSIPFRHIGGGRVND